jgi:RNA polymerase sigma-70 factor (ECF subfamily)
VPIPHKIAGRTLGEHLLKTEKAELADLLRAVAREDRAAYKRLYEQAGPKLFGIVLRITRNRSAAEDILQDVFLRIWQNAHSFSPDAGPPMAWLSSIARNRAIDVLRQKTFVSVASDNEDETDWFERIADPRDLEDEMMNIAALRHCLGQIEEPARICVLLAYYEGYSREELAERYGKPVNTIKTWLHRSLAVLKDCLEGAA